MLQRQIFPRREHLRYGHQFRRVYEHGRKYIGRYMVLYAMPTPAAVRAAFQTALAKTTDTTEKSRLHLRMARLALNTGNIQEAEQMLQAAGSDVKMAASPQFESARQQLFEGLLTHAAKTESRDQAERFLSAAQKHLFEAVNKRQWTAARIRYLEKFDSPVKSLLFAQETSLASREGKTKDAALYQACQSEIQRLIQQHGAVAQSALDERFTAELKNGPRTTDPLALIEMWYRWPHATGAGDAALMAAEKLLERDPKNPVTGAEASRISGAVRNAVSEQSQRKAVAAQAIVDLKFRPRYACSRDAEWQSVPPQTAIRFGGFEGTAGMLRQTLLQRRDQPMPERDAVFVNMPPEWCWLYSIDANAGMVVLRDSRGNPLRWGDRLFCWSDGRLICWDSQLDSESKAVLWSATIPNAASEGRPLSQLTEDQAYVALASHNTLTLVETATGRTRWQKQLPLSRPSLRITGENDWLVALNPDNRLIGIKATTGELVWQAPIPASSVSFMTLSDAILHVRTSADMSLCYDARNGRLLHETKITCERCDPGFAVVLNGGLLVVADGAGTVQMRNLRLGDVRNANNLGRTLQGWRTAAVDENGRYLVMFMGADQGIARVLDMADLNHGILLNLRDEITQRNRVPVRAALIGNQAVVLHARADQRADLLDPILTAFDLRTGEPVWNQSLSNQPESLYQVSALEVSGDLVGLSVRSTIEGNMVRLLVFRADTGQMTDCARALPDGGRGAHHRGPIVLNGRAVVEYPKGMAILGGVGQ